MGAGMEASPMVSTNRIDGKRVVVTGATSGIGKAAALDLARRGAEITIVCRNPEKGKATAAEIEAAAPGAAADIVLCDLSELEQVHRAAAELNDRYSSIDVLVNNAGVQNLTPRLTSDGFDHMLASNYLGPFLLTNLVLDRVTAAPAGRVVVVASEAHRVAGRLDPETFEHLGAYGRTTAVRAYGRTKLLDLLFALELARRLEEQGTGTTANALCPGLVSTNLVEGKGLGGAVDRLLTRTPLLRTPEQGARVVVKLASDPQMEGVTGRFFTSTPGAGLLPSVRAVGDEALQRRVWERTCELVGLTPSPS